MHRMDVGGGGPAGNGGPSGFDPGVRPLALIMHVILRLLYT